MRTFSKIFGLAGLRLGYLLRAGDWAIRCGPRRSAPSRQTPTSSCWTWAAPTTWRSARRSRAQDILVRAGSEFGLPGHARVTTGEEALMDDVARRLVALVGA
jgi:histidinol-phosphate/aromatic aminotransferase/cobyric acid decarboxylase-like protein